MEKLTEGEGPMAGVTGTILCKRSGDGNMFVCHDGWRFPEGKTLHSVRT